MYTNFDCVTFMVRNGYGLFIHTHTHTPCRCNTSCWLLQLLKLSNTSVATTCSCCGCVVGRNRIKNTLDLPGHTKWKNDRMFRKVTSAWWLASLNVFGHLLYSAIRHQIIQISVAGLQIRKEINMFKCYSQGLVYFHAISQSLSVFFLLSNSPAFHLNSVLK